MYKLRAYGGENSQRKQIDFTVLPKLFREEHINLNSELTLLRTTEEDRKREEALEIQALYALFNPESVFGDLSFISPIRFDTLDYFRVSSEYGDRRLFQYSNDKSSRAIHTGIDMAAREGVEVYAAAPGMVVLAKDRIISGMSVVLEHLPGVYSIYFHLDSIQVETGELVEQAQVIGTVGMSGLATGPHLHWEVRVNGVAVDPKPLTQVVIPDTIHATGIGE
ncbi:MAG: M23 family metallopeptidase, partial [Sediminispirochaetaceae bacterium]